MVAPILIPLAILGGMDGVEPLRASVPLCEKPKLNEIVIRREERLAGVREIARLTGYSPAHVCYARREDLAAPAAQDGRARSEVQVTEAGRCRPTRT